MSRAHRRSPPRVGPSGMMLVAALAIGLSSCASPMRYTSAGYEAPGPLPAPLGPAPASPPPSPSHAVDPGRAQTVLLHEILDKAQSESFAVLAAQARLAEARARTQQADGALGPVLDVRGGAGFFTGRTQGNFGDVGDATFWRFDPSVGLIYRVNLGGDLLRTKAARREQDASALDVAEAQRQAMLGVAMAHHDLALTQVSVEVATQLVADGERFLEIAQARADAEVASEADVELARAELASARRVRVEAVGEWEAAGAMLATLLRQDPGQPLAVATADLSQRDLVRLDSAAALAEHARDDRPDLQAAEHRIEAARVQERAARLDVFVPDLAVELRERFIGSGASNIGPGTIAQGFVGWTFSLADLGRVRTAKRARETLEIDIGRLAAEAAGEVHAQTARARAMQQAIEQAAEALASTEHHHAIQIARFEVGAALGLEVIVAQNAVARARLDLAATVLRYNVQQLRILAAMGRLEPAVVAG